VGPRYCWFLSCAGDGDGLDGSITTASYWLCPNFLVFGLLLYRTFKLNVSIEFQPREHTAYFHQWGIVSEEESFQASYNNRPIISAWLVRIRLRVYSGDTVEGVKVNLTEVKECEELRGMLPFALHFKNDNTIPHKTCIDLHPDDDHLSRMNSQ
jgi:hypothetical protein